MEYNYELIWHYYKQSSIRGNEKAHNYAIWKKGLTEEQAEKFAVFAAGFILGEIIAHDVAGLS